MMFTAERAKLAELHPLRHCLLVFHAGVVLAFAFATLQSDLFACHVMSFSLT